MKRGSVARGHLNLLTGTREDSGESPPNSSEHLCKAVGMGVVPSRREGGCWRMKEDIVVFPSRCCGKGVKKSPDLAMMVA